jgi:hypothetical protein
MNAFDEALCRYANGQFSDEDVMRCTGLSRRAWRELIKTKAVATITAREGGRGHVRRCDATVLKRAAVIAVLNRAGLSLAISGFVAYSLPFHTLLYETVDPWTVLFGRLPDSNVGAPLLPERVKRPIADWFAPHRPSKADPENDCLISIFDSRFVGAVYRGKETPVIFGDLRNDATSFVAWWPLGGGIPQMGPVIEAVLSGRSAKFLNHVSDWEDPTRWSKELKALGYRYEKHNEDHDPLCIAAKASFRGPIVTTSVNVSLAIRKALRRYLNIEP